MIQNNHTGHGPYWIDLNVIFKPGHLPTPGDYEVPRSERFQLTAIPDQSSPNDYPTQYSVRWTAPTQSRPAEYFQLHGDANDPE